MKVVISVNRKYEEVIITIHYASSSDLEILSEILTDYISKINDSIEFQAFHSPTQWTFLIYTPNKTNNIMEDLNILINEGFGIEVVEVKTYE